MTNTAGAPIAAARARDAYLAFRSHSYFGSLDGLRCLSILAVLWHHTKPGAYLHIPLFERGYMGVNLFFVISGFLITTLLLRERERYGYLSLSAFYWRRSLRIFPLYYLMLLVYTLAVVVIEKNPVDKATFFDNLPAFLTYTTNWLVPSKADTETQRVIFYFAWSLAVEEQFYLVWPSIEKVLRGMWAVLAMIGLIIVVYLHRQGTFISIFPVDSTGYQVLWYIEPAICFGVLMAHALHSPKVYGWLYRVVGKPWVSPLALALVVGVCALPTRSIDWDYGVCGALTLLVLSCVIIEDHWLARFLSLKPVRTIGIISYGVYMMHMLCLNVLRQVLGHLGINSPTLNFLLLIPISAGVAWFVYRYYETIFLRVKTRFSRQPTTHRVTAGSGPAQAA